jgi:glycosyltransferase involved in cell wall biosynthesis
MAQEARLQVVMTGPLPPAVGGMTTLISNLANSSLAEMVRLELFNTGKTTPLNRPWYQGVAARAKLLRKYWRMLSDAPERIVHIHSCSGLTFFLDGMLLLIARWSGHKTLLHVHGGYFDVFLDNLNAPLRRLAQHLARSADRFIVLSHEWCTKLGPRLPGVFMVTVVNGVPAMPRTEVPKTVDSTFRLLFLGSLSQNKGLLDLVEALSGLPGHIQLVIAGAESEPGFAERLKEECAQMGMETRTKFIGQVTGQAKIDCLQSADLFVLPSYAEGLPISLLEAMAARLPVIASSVGGIPSVIDDGVHGRLVRPRDIPQLRQAIEEMAIDSEKRRLMSEAAYSRWLELFNIERTAEQLLNLYLCLAQRSGSFPQRVPHS